MKFIIRLLALPFVTGIITIAHVLFILKRLYSFMKYGGEFIQYEKNEGVIIQDIYLELKNQRKQDHEPDKH